MDRLAVDRLANGQELEISVIRPGRDRGDSSLTNELLTFIVRPFEPWMSPAEATILARCLSGRTGGGLADHLYVARIEGRLAGTVWHATGVGIPELGACGFVFTEPAFRGLGIAGRLTRLALADFWAGGGLASYLGTSNPIARHIYGQHGFEAYNGVVMRALRQGLSAGELDRWLTMDGNGNEAIIRPMTLADLGAYTALLLSVDTRMGSIRDASEAIFYAPRGLVATGCHRPFYSAYLRSEASPGSAFMAAVSTSGRMVGAASLIGPPGGALQGIAALEFVGRAGPGSEIEQLLRTTLRAGAAGGLVVARCWAETDPSTPRRLLLRELGFELEAVLSRQLDIGTGRTSIAVLRLELA